MRITIDQACEKLRQGGLVAIPTETVYGLAALLEKPEAIASLYEIKQRPSDNPLIIHLADQADLQGFALNYPEGIDALLDAFWPGPLTVVLPVDDGKIPAIARAHLKTAAFRIPKHPMAREIVRQAGALVAPSANVSGRPSSTTPDHVEADFGEDFPVVDGGPCTEGIESTILIFSEGRWHVGRLGAIDAGEFTKVLGYRPHIYRSEKRIQALCPGIFHRHYSPNAKLVMGQEPYSGSPSNVVGFSDRQYPGALRVFALGNSRDPRSAAQALYATLRQLDSEGVSAAWVDMNFPDTGLWHTLRDRLTRAAQ